jgi:primosomal protein N' (replication factor Y) (superfamily II helicase)
MKSAPLRLKVQKVARGNFETAKHLPVATVLVDTGVPHLDEVYDYLVPDFLDEELRTGVKVSVNFSGRNVDGYILSRSESSAVGNLKFIEKVLSPIPLLTPDTRALISAVSKRWASTSFDILTSAIPARVVNAEKAFQSLDSPSALPESTTAPTQSFYLFTPGEDPFTVMGDWVRKRSALGGVLVVLPEAREVALLSEKLKAMALNFSVLDGSLTRTERYSNFLDVASGNVQIVIGSRSAIFAPVNNLRTLILFREGSQSHYEVRTPGWNTRDVAIIRSQMGSIDLTFAGFSPSSEVAHLIDRGDVLLKGQSASVDATSFTAHYGELLPDRIFAPIRKALEKGSVLFLVSRKGYSTAISCKSCRNIAICDCGGRISFDGPEKGYRCSLCDKKAITWSCRWCKKDQPVLLGRGNQRFAQEIGRAFPGFPVLISDANAPIDEVSEERSLVLATAGMAPVAKNGYQAVVILEGDALFAQLDLRAQERAREAIMQSVALVAKKGKALLVIDSAHPIIASVSRWNLAPLLMRELSERSQTHLPPVVHAITIEVAHGECSSFLAGIEKSAAEGRISPSTRILGPTKISDENSRVIITVPLDEGEDLVDFLDTYRKKRALAKKPALTMRVDPYSLS